MGLQVSSSTLLENHIVQENAVGQIWRGQPVYLDSGQIDGVLVFIPQAVIETPVFFCPGDEAPRFVGLAWRC